MCWGERVDSGTGGSLDQENWIPIQREEARALQGLWRTAANIPNLCSSPTTSLLPQSLFPLSHLVTHILLLILHSFPLFSPKVKIWFQNKRSKYKKFLKQNSGGQEGNFSGRPPSLSSCAPLLPTLWDLPKAAALPTSGYGNSFGTWYQHHSTDVLAPAQMM